MQVYFAHHAQTLPLDGDFQPGDIVTLDTGIRKRQRPMTHIGIVDDVKDEGGNFRSLTSGDTGLRTASMSLLGQTYPTVVGHFG